MLREGIEKAKENLKTAKQDTYHDKENLKVEKKAVKKLISDELNYIETLNEAGSSYPEMTILSKDKAVSKVTAVRKMRSEIDELGRKIEKLDESVKIRCFNEAEKHCDTFNDLSKTIWATESDQLATEYIMLHLSLSQKWRIVPVISRTIYHKIQKRILPYHINLFVLLSKSLFLVLFTYFCIEFIRQRQESNFIVIVQVLTTMSVSILPYFFNVLFLTPNEHEKEAWNEMTKINVKHLV